MAAGDERTPGGAGDDRADVVGNGSAALDEDAAAAGNRSASPDDAPKPAAGNGAVVDLADDGSALVELAGAAEPDGPLADDQTSGQG